MPNNLSPLEEIQRRLLELEEWSRQLQGEISLLNAVQIALEEGHTTKRGLTPGLFALLEHLTQLNGKLDQVLDQARGALAQD